MILRKCMIRKSVSVHKSKKHWDELLQYSVLLHDHKTVLSDSIVPMPNCVMTRFWPMLNKYSQGQRVQTTCAIHTSKYNVDVQVYQSMA
jgi:hypothetical protein